MKVEFALPVEDLPSVFESDFGSEQKSIGLGESLDFGLVELVSPQSHDVDASRSRRMTFHEDVGWHIAANRAEPADKGVAADRCVVMDTDASREDSVIVDVDMTAQQSAVRHDRVVSYLAVVGGVTAGHQEVVVADSRNAFLFLRTAIDRDRLANDVVIANQNLRIGPAERNILRFTADNGAGIYLVVLADLNVAHQGHAAMETRSSPYFDVRPDRTERSDMDLVGDLGSRIDRHVVGKEGSHDRLLLGNGEVTLPRGYPAVFLSWLWLSCNGCVPERSGDELSRSFRSSAAPVFKCGFTLSLNCANEFGIQAMPASIGHEMTDQVATG